nr:D3 [Mus musculus]
MEAGERQEGSEKEAENYQGEEAAPPETSYVFVATLGTKVRRRRSNFVRSLTKRSKFRLALHTPVSKINLAFPKPVAVIEEETCLVIMVPYPRPCP